MLRQVDPLDAVNLVGWRYADPPGELAARLGIAPPSPSYAQTGRERRPTIHDAALGADAGQRLSVLRDGERIRLSIADVPQWTVGQE